MKYPLLSKLLLREYGEEALNEITSGRDLLPFTTNEKRHIASVFSEKAQPELMNGDNILLAAFYNTPIRYQFKMRDELIEGVSSKTYCNEVLNEIRDALQTTNCKHLGKYHRNLISLMIMCPNIPNKILNEVIENSDLTQRDVNGRSALDCACISLKLVDPPNKAAVLEIYEKTGIKSLQEYEMSIQKHHTKKNEMVSAHSYIEGFKTIQEMVKSVESKPQANMRF